MTPLEDMNIGGRIVLTIIIVLVILFALALFGWSTGKWDEAPAAPSKEIALCSDEPDINDRINRIAFEALEDSLRQQIGHLLLVWLKDNTGQPARAKVGVEQAVYAYLHAREAIYRWNVPRCTQ